MIKMTNKKIYKIGISFCRFCFLFLFTLYFFVLASHFNKSTCIISFCFLIIILICLIGMIIIDIISNHHAGVK
jgi:hypothetical protein